MSRLDARWAPTIVIDEVKTTINGLTNGQLVL